MPGGLPDVTQRFDADTAGYIAGIERMIAANRELVASIGDAQRKLNDARSAGGGDNYGMFGPGGVAQIREYGKAMDEYAAAMKEAAARNAEFNAMQSQTERLSSEGRDALNSLSAEYRRHGETIAQAKQAQALFRDGLIDQANSTQDAIVAMGEHEQAVARLAKVYGTAQEAFAKADFSSPLQFTARDMAQLNAVLQNTHQSADGAVRAIGQLAAVGSGGGAGALAAILGRGGGGGGGAGIPSWASLAAAAAGPPGGGGWDKGTAGAMWGPVGTFLSTWLPRAHYVLMAANELAATLGPATIAAGMGALVGMQGGEQAIPRLQAVFNTAESLGGSLGTTAGQYMGLKGSPLQTAQNLATGAAFEGIGAMTNMLRAGAGNAFVQLGSNTVSMWSRMMAGLTQEMQAGMGNQLGGLVSGGTGYLAQFGKIFGNIGHLFLNTAPYLPGVGGDYLSILQGATGGLAGLTKFMGPGVAPLLAMEAGARLGTPLLGGVGSLLGRAGGGLAGLGDLLGGAGIAGGLTGADAAAIAELTSVSLAGGGGASLLGGLLGRGGVGIARVGGFLGGLTAPDVGGLAALALLIGKGAGYQTPMQQTVSGMLTGVGQQGIVQGLPSIISDMQRLATTPYSAAQGATGQQNYWQSMTRDLSAARHGNIGGMWGAAVQGMHGVLQMIGLQGTDPNTYQAAQNGLERLSETMVNSLGTGRQVQDVWKGLTGASIGMGKAFDIATMAQLQLGSAFEKNGKLTSTAVTMIKNLQAGYAPMNMNTGQFGSAVAAQTAMSGLAHTQVGAVNQSYDQLLQLVQGGASGTAALATLLRAMPAGSGTAMKGFLSPSSAAAWTAFASTSQPSVISQLQSQTDWLRQAQTMGALGSGQTAGMAEFLLGRALPSAKGSPAALAMLSTIAQQFGGPAFAPGTSAAQMYKSLSAFAGQGVGAGGYTSLMTRGTEGLANIGRDAQQFIQQIGSGIGGAMAQGIATHGATIQDAFMNSVGGKGGFSQAALGKYTQFLTGSGVPKQGIEDMASYAAKLAGASPALQQKIRMQVELQVDTASLKSSLAAAGHASTIKPAIDVGNAKAQLASALKAKGTIDYQNKTTPVPEQHAHGTVNYTNRVQAPPNPPNIQRVINYVVRVSGNVAGAVAAGNLGKTAGFQTGGLVPGSGSGDIIPAMLEPGEAIIPRSLVSLVAPILAAHRVPGFGGMPQGASTHFAGGGIVPHVLGFPDPTIAGHAGKQFAFTLIDGLTEALKSSGAKKIADALISKIGQEVAYAKNIASSVQSGLNLAGMDLTQGSVLQQMQGYAATSAMFGSDLGKLRKGHLNKALIAQLIGAGPVQGDQLAQSILGTGIGGVNAEWAQIVKSSKVIGAQGAMAQYGGYLSPNLQHASVTQNHVTINVNASGSSGSLNLTAAQVKQLVQAVQAALLKQARRNQKTGLQLSGKGA